MTGTWDKGVGKKKEDGTDTMSLYSQFPVDYAWQRCESKAPRHHNGNVENGCGASGESMERRGYHCMERSTEKTVQIRDATVGPPKL